MSFSTVSASACILEISKAKLLAWVLQDEESGHRLIHKNITSPLDATKAYMLDLSISFMVSKKRRKEILAFIFLHKLPTFSSFVHEQRSQDTS